MKVLFLGGFAASQFEWIAPVIESNVEISVCRMIVYRVR